MLPLIFPINTLALTKSFSLDFSHFNLFGNHNQFLARKNKDKWRKLLNIYQIGLDWEWPR